MGLGDSFANHYYAGVAAHPKFADDVVLSIGACEPSPMYEHEVVADDPQIFSPCTSRRRYDQQLLINDIIAKGTLRLVIMAGIVPEPSEDYIRRINERIAFIESNGAQVVMILPHLRSDYFTEACFARPLQPTPQTCVEPATKAFDLRQGVQPLIDSVSASHPTVRFFDPNTVNCSTAECSFMIEGRPLFRDEYDHLSNLGSRLMVERLVETTMQ